MIIAIFFSLFIAIKCDELKMMYEVFRHGARGPMHQGYDSKTFRTQGALTGVGMRQHFNLGKILRKIYIEDNNLLSPDYNETEIYVRSSDHSRTLESAQSQLLGLYENSGPKINKNISQKYLNPPFSYIDSIENKYGSALPCNILPVPVHTVLITKDYLTQSMFICPKGKYFMSLAKMSLFYKSFSIRFKDTLNYAGSFYGKETITMEEAYGLMDVFQNDIFAGHALPKNMTIYHWKNLEKIYDMHLYYLLFGNRDAQKLHTYKIFKSVLNNFEAHKLKNSPLKAFLLSAHDDNLAALFTVLNFTNYACLLKSRSEECLGTPGYASQVIFELWEEEISNKLYVKVLVDGKEKPISKERMDNGKLYLEQFKETVSEFLNIPFRKLCNVNNLKK